MLYWVPLISVHGSVLARTVLFHESAELAASPCGVQSLLLHGTGGPGVAQAARVLCGDSPPAHVRARCLGGCCAPLYARRPPARRRQTKRALVEGPRGCARRGSASGSRDSTVPRAWHAVVGSPLPRAVLSLRSHLCQPWATAEPHLRLELLQRRRELMGQHGRHCRSHGRRYPQAHPGCLDHHSHNSGHHHCHDVLATLSGHSCDHIQSSDSPHAQWGCMRLEPGVTEGLSGEH
ncbi:hypothetical protein NDU88_006747 [Pleurodeles waltl]|uniref:Uncharacterized protein n=1 Tax=Pleurodeles waltl TaxID=8319 RepID=A0AAV7PRJ6_PLEWA|nr:hypothetical protein NDU88_006747 [Pleurodeles waltl]